MKDKKYKYEYHITIYYGGNNTLYYDIETNKTYKQLVKWYKKALKKKMLYLGPDENKSYIINCKEIGLIEIKIQKESF